MTERWTGERARARSRTTGTTIVLIDTHAEPQWLDSDGGRWATVCDEHSTVVNHTTLALARQWLHGAAEWCEECMS